MQWILMPFRRLGDVNGRSRRTEFWLFGLAALFVQMIAGFVDAVTDQEIIVLGMGPVTLLITLALLVPTATVGIRRLHDVGWRGWWTLLFGLPYLGWLGSVETGAQTIFAALALLVGSGILLVLLVQPGTPGDNAYGPNPKTMGNDGIADTGTSP